MPTAVEELVSSRTQGREDVLEVRGSARRRAQCRRIERAASHGEEREAREAAAYLEVARADVLVRDAIADKMEDWPREECCEP
jgi:hypothetical protein